MKTGLLNPQGAVNLDSWQLEYENTLSSAATSVTISSLTGDTAEVYLFTLRVVNDYDGANTVYLRPNNDSAGNYGFQMVRGEDSTMSAARATSVTGYQLTGQPALDDVATVNFIIYAKSGYIRTGIEASTYGTSGTTVTGLRMDGQSWSNTADEITSLVLAASQADGLGVGTYIALYKKVVKT